MAREVVEIEARCRRGHPAFELEEVLEALKEPGRHLCWSIEKLYAVGRPALLGRTMWQLGDEISKSPGGLKLNWDELEVLAAGCFQVVDARIVGSEETADAGSRDVVVEVEWGTHWRFTSHDRTVLERCKRLEHAIPGAAGQQLDEDPCELGDERLVNEEDDQTVDLPC